VKDVVNGTQHFNKYEMKQNFEMVFLYQIYFWCLCCEQKYHAQVKHRRKTCSQRQSLKS